MRWRANTNCGRSGFEEEKGLGEPCLCAGKVGHSRVYM